MVLKFSGKAQNIDFSDILPGLRAAAGGRWWRVAGRADALHAATALLTGQACN